MTTKSLSAEEINHLRAVYLCYRLAPEAVRAYFDKQHPPSQLVSDLTKEEPNLRKIKGKILKPYQWNQLFPPTGASPPVSTQFDITLLICLLRNMNPVIPPPPFGFDKLPHSSHTTDGAHIARIKYYRNNLAHSTDGKLSNTDFLNLWNEMELAIKGLGGVKFSHEIQIAKTRCLDDSLSEILRQLTECGRQYNELSADITNNMSTMKSKLENTKLEDEEKITDIRKKINETEDKIKEKLHVLEDTRKQTSETLTMVEGEMYDLGVQLCTEMEHFATELEEIQTTVADLKLETIPGNRRELISMHLEKWTNDDEFFIKTRAADKIYSLIKSKSWLTVTGNSGIGKTMTVRHTALKMVKDGFTIIPISHPKEIAKLFSTQRKVVFVIDDLCGRYTFNQSYLDRLKLKLEDLKLILEKGYSKIIATCRLQVFKDIKFKTLSVLNMYECNLNSKDLCLTSDEIDTFVANYFPEHVDKAKRLSKEYDCFPLLCSLYNKNKDVDFDIFCRNPFQYFGTELDNLLLEGDEGKYKNSVLALLVIYNNSLSENTFEGKLDANAREIFEGVLEACEVSRSTSPKCLHKALETLIGTFVIKEEKSYRMIHDKLFDFIAFHLGQTMIHILIEHADSGFIRERFLWDMDNIEETESFIIKIPDEKVDTYVKRLIRDWTDKNMSVVFNNRNLKSLVFTDKVLLHLNGLGNACHLELANALENSEFPDTALICSIVAGNIELAQWILEHGADANQCGSDHVSPIYLASQDGLVLIVTHLLRHGATINFSDENGLSPLHKACDNGHETLVKQLLENDYVNIDLCENDGCSPLYLACHRGYLQIVRQLLQYGVDINKCDKNGLSPLHKASCNGHTDVVMVLLKNDSIKVDLCDNVGYSSLYMACQKGYIEIIKLLLQHGADANKCSRHGWSSLHTACYNGHKNVVTELLEYGNVNLDICNNNGFSALYLSCQEGFVNIVRDLIHNGADINKCDENGLSPLYIACSIGNTDVTRVLLKNENVQKDSCDVNGCTPLYLASQKGFVQIVGDLLHHGADMNKCSQCGWSPLHTASKHGQIGVVTELLNNDNVKINLCDDFGSSSLFLACQEGYVQIIINLIQSGANINKCNKLGLSPLHEACSYQKIDVVTELLMNDNVNIDMCDKEGRSSLYLGCQMGCIPIVRNLLQHGADINSFEKNDQSPLYIACTTGNKDMVAELLNDDNVKIDLCDNKGYSPLFVACKDGYVEIVIDLLQHGADINKCSKSGISPLVGACGNGQVDVITKLLENDNMVIDLCDNTGCTALNLVCKIGFAPIARNLIQHGANINKCNKLGLSPLHEACSYQKIDVVTELLMNDNVNIDMCDKEGRSSLYLGCQMGCIPIVRNLLQHGADINSFEKNDQSPLYIACTTGNKDMVAELLNDDNVKIDLCDNKGYSPLFVACKDGYVEIVIDLLQHGADINKCSKSGISPLVGACGNGQVDVITKLLENDNMVIDLCDNTGCTALNLVCKIGFAPIARNLIQHGADINMCNKYGQSPLHVACASRQLGVITELLNNDNVKTDLLDNEGHSPMYLACQNGNVLIVGELLKHGVDIIKHDEDDINIKETAKLRVSSSPLHIACSKGHLEVVKLLLEQIPNVNLTDDDGATPLFLAFAAGHMEIISILINKGADVSICRRDGKSPSEIAIENGHTSLKSVLRRHDKSSRSRCNIL